MEPIGTLDVKYVADYARTSLSDVEELDVLTFFTLLHDATTYQLMQSKEGQEYLEKCARMRMTEPDVGGLREAQR